MVMFGLDISHHQDVFDLARAKREGIAFVIAKATEGSAFTDSRFNANLDAARSAGLLVAAYHYQRAGVSAAAQVAHIRAVVPRDVSVILDVEANSGSVALTRDLVARLRSAGYRVPLLYLPRWYWQQIGSPSLAGLPPLWSSRYPDMVQGTLADEWDGVPASYWDGHGGLPVAVLQFTSSARIAGRAPIDANAYRGTAAQLAALLGGEEDDVSYQDAYDAIRDFMGRKITNPREDAAPGTETSLATQLQFSDWRYVRTLNAVRAMVEPLYDDEAKAAAAFAQVDAQLAELGDPISPEEHARALAETLPGAVLTALRDLINEGN